MRPASLRNAIVLTSAILLTALSANAAPTLPTADQVMTQAEASAAAQHKNILLDFGASWCGNCHLFEHFLADPAIKPIIDHSFVIARLDDGELPNDTHHANSPGAVALRAKLGGAKAGYPFILMLSPNGHPIVTSLRPDPATPGGNNVGYPALPVEIDWFMHMLQLSAPTLTPQQTATIQSWLKAHAS
ncbi:MAG: thioredoxin family protein [Acidobacteriaceae bacterium]